MKPRIKTATTLTPDGGEMTLYRHDHDFSIVVNGEDLMHSRRHESELALARLGCTHLAAHKTPRILIGGLGMGYTLRQALDILSSHAHVVVYELLPAVVEWNREFFGKLNGQPLSDPRVDLQVGNVIDMISGTRNRFDAILLDIDNGPNAMTDSGNHRLYGHGGIEFCRRALKKKGCLAVWAATPDKSFEQRLMNGGFHVVRFRVPAYKGKKPQSHFVWVASENRAILPAGGGKPRALRNRRSKRHYRGRR